MNTDSPSTPTDVIDRGDAVAVIGAGPAGLSIARMLRKYGVEYDQFERHSGVGGLWDIDNPGTPMYESAHFISSRDMSGFFDHPMPKWYGDYPSRTQILEYTTGFAATFGLTDGIEFDTEITAVTPLADGRWLVTPDGGTPRRYRGVVCASGTNWHPRTPAHPGRFDGEIRHAVTHRSATDFSGKRVLVVGLGNSGADIACDAAQAASAAFVSVRRGYHIIPKHLFGVPADQFDDGVSIPRWIERPLVTGLVRLLVGDVTKWGLPKPDHKMFESHPLMNSQLLHHLQHADVRIKADVERFDGPDVVFTDGSREQIDVVLYATGYQMRIPYVDEKLFDWNGDRPAQYLTAFNREHRNLFTLGFIEVNSSAYTLFDNISNVIAQYLHDQLVVPERAARLDELIRNDDPDLTGGLAMVSSERHAGYVDAKTYKRELARVRDQVGLAPLVPGFADRLRVAAPVLSAPH